MSGYKKGSDVLTEWDIRGFELLEIVQKGLQPHNQNGLPIPPPEISCKRMEIAELYRQCKKLEREMVSPILDKPLPEYTKKDFMLARIGYAIEMSERNRPKIENLKESIQKCEKELAPFKKNEWGLFQFKTDQQISEAIRVLTESLFRKADLEKFLPAQKKLTTEKLAKVTGHKEFNDFISKTKIGYESDTEIKIHVPGRPPAIWSFKKLGFRSYQDKGWQDLLSILNTGFFSVGSSVSCKVALTSHNFQEGTANTNYDKLQKRLDSVNRKMTEFFKREYGLNISEGVKFFLSSRSERAGTYRPVFQIIQEKREKLEYDYMTFTVNQLREERKFLMRELLDDKKGQLYKNQINKKLNIFADVLKKRNLTRAVCTDEDEIEIGRELPEALDESSLE
jgi:hypothetical protein